MSTTESEIIDPMSRNHKHYREFSFEDGTLLHNYPPSIDIKLSDKDEVHRVSILGSCNIYSSQLVCTDNGEPTESATGKITSLRIVVNALKYLA